MPHGNRNRNDVFSTLLTVKVTKDQICDGTISKMHVTRSTISVESFMILQKSARFS